MNYIKNIGLLAQHMLNVRYKVDRLIEVNDTPEFRTEIFDSIAGGLVTNNAVRGLVGKPWGLGPQYGIIYDFLFDKLLKQEERFFNYIERAEGVPRLNPNDGIPRGVTT